MSKGDIICLSRLFLYKHPSKNGEQKWQSVALLTRSSETWDNHSFPNNNHSSSGEIFHEWAIPSPTLINLTTRTGTRSIWFVPYNISLELLGQDERNWWYWPQPGSLGPATKQLNKYHRFLRSVLQSVWVSWAAITKYRHNSEIL